MLAVVVGLATRIPRPGIVAMVAAAFLFSANTALAKLLVNSSYSPFVILFCRALVTCWGSTAALVHAKALPVPHVPGTRVYVAWAMARGLFGAVSIACLYVAVSMMPIAEAVTLHSLNPIFAMLFGLLLLGERLSLMRGAAMLLFVAGAVVVSNPFGGAADAPSKSQLWAGRSVAVAGSICAGAAIACARKLTQPLHFGADGSPPPPVHSMAQAWWQGFVSLALAPVATLVMGATPLRQYSHIATFLGMGLCALLGQLGVGFAARREHAGVIGVLWNLDIVFSLVWQTAVFGDAATWYQIVGALLVTLASLVAIADKDCSLRCRRNPENGDGDGREPAADIIERVSMAPSSASPEGTMRIVMG